MLIESSARTSFQVEGESDRLFAARRTRFFSIAVLAAAVVLTGSCVGRFPGKGGAAEEALGLIEGEFCDLAKRRGFVNVVESSGVVSLDVSIDADVPHTLGAAVLDQRPCQHFHPTACATSCEATEDCSYDGECTALVEHVVGARVTVTSLAGALSATTDAVGRIDAELTAAPDGIYTIDADIPGVGAIAFTAPLPGVFVDGVTFIDRGGANTSAPVEVSWTPAHDGSLMDLRLSPNHHRPIGFSRCRLDDDEGSVTVSAAMMDPLRPPTGFEGGQARRSFVARIESSGGCIEIAVVREERLDDAT